MNENFSNTSFAKREKDKRQQTSTKNAPKNRLRHERKSFVDREIARRGHQIHKLKAKDSTGRWAYYFVLVLPGKESAFMKVIGGEGMINLEDYGEVIASCYGESPTQEVRDYLKEKYNFDV